MGWVGPGGMSRRQVLRSMGAAALAAPAAGSLAACGGPGSGDSSSLDLVYLGDATQQEAFNALFAEFNKSRPKVKIKARGIAAETWGNFANTVSTQIAGGKVPDIVQVATEGQRLFASKSLLEPLDPYMDRDRKVVDDYFGDADPKLKEWTETYGSTDGKTYFIPGGYNTSVLYCNTKVFADAGVDLPEDGWSWDDFRAAGERIKSRTGAFLLPAGYAFPFLDIMPWLLTNGASTHNAAWDEATFDSPAAVEAAEFVKGLIDDGLSPKPGGDFNAAAQVQKGRLATFGAGRWATLDMRRLKLTDSVRIVPWPRNAGPGASVGWDGWPILRASKNKDAAWEFLKWMMSKEASTFYASAGGTNIPARNSVAASPAFTDDAPAGTGNLPAALGYGTPIPSPERGAEAQAAITQGWQAAITGNQSAEDALGSANDKLSGLL
ncbi:ABC transporter substrate-binding protein [Streptomyces sp. MAR4 CNY-716]